MRRDGRNDGSDGSERTDRPGGRGRAVRAGGAGGDVRAGIDALDDRLVTLLVADARRSFADLGTEVGLSASAVKRRVDRLRADGVITGFTVRLDPAALGWTVEGYVELYCRPSTPPAAIRRAVEGLAEVVDASTVSGDADALVHILAADMRHFEQVLEQIGSERFVERTKSVLVLSPLIRRSTPTH